MSSATPTLDTFINASIEIDELVDPSGTTFPADDANLFVGADPADGTASAQKPGGGPSTWLDWNDLGLPATSMANHRLLDCPADPSACTSNGQDPTSFPENNNCVGASSVLSKMDIDYVGFANNNDYAYAIVQRSGNSGDAGWYWLFTKNPPVLGAYGSGGCKAAEQPLTYNLSGSASATAGADVLVVGHFQASSAPLVEVYRAIANTTGTTAVDATNYANAALWQQVSSGVANAAVNTTGTAPGSFGLTGVTKTALLSKGQAGCNAATAPAQCLGADIVAEAGVPISVFTGGASACGATFYASVITRSSGSGGTTADLKDLAGPALFRFGNTTATATLTPMCGLAFGYAATGTNDQGTLASPTCTWTFKDAAGNVVGSSSTCSGTFAPAVAGTYTGTVSVVDPSNTGCTGSATSGAVAVYAPLAATPTLTPTCSSTFSYASSVTGGSGSYTYAWSFGGACKPATTSSTTASGGPIAVGSPGPASSCTASLVVTDARTDVAGCTASGSASTTPLAPITMALTVSPTAASCSAGSTFDDSVLFTATASGGSGSYGYAWTAPCAASSATGVAGATTCTVNPADDTCPSLSFTVTATDSNPMCTGAPSHGGSYAKSVSLSASVQ